MYVLKRKNEVAYDIVLREKSIGTVILSKGKWTAVVGKVTYSSKTRKQAVEQVLYMIIMSYAGPIYREKQEETANEIVESVVL